MPVSPPGQDALDITTDRTVTTLLNLDHALRLSYGVITPEPAPVAEPDPERTPADELALLVPLVEQLVPRAEVFGYLQDGVLYWFDEHHRQVFQLAEVGNPLPERVVELISSAQGALVMYEDVASADVAGWGLVRALRPYENERQLHNDMIRVYEATAKLLAERETKLDVPVKHGYVLALEALKAASISIERQQTNSAVLSEGQRVLGMKQAMQALFVVQSLNNNNF